MEGTFNFWELLAGVGIFIFGMLLLEDSLKALSGKAFKRIIWLYTKGRMRAIASGSFITGILQSSTAVSMMVLAFVGAGIMSMENAIGVIMGSNIGTTMTAWIVATFGFKLKISAFALPLVGIGGSGLIFFTKPSRMYHIFRHLIGFGFLFLGLDYMKTGVEELTQSFDITLIKDYGLWFYLIIGMMLTALMHSSSACIAIVLTALNGEIINFEMGAAMVIGANIGTTITVIIGSLGGIPAKKRVGISHLIFNIVTGIVAFAGISILVSIVDFFFDIEGNSVMALAFFHTLFNILGVTLFFPFMGLLSHMLVKFYPDRKQLLSMYINNTPVEVSDAASTALKKEVIHLLGECQIYNLRLLKIDSELAFRNDSHFEKDENRKLSRSDLYEKIKLLHAEIFAYYSRLQAQKLDEDDSKELERIIYASRNMMNSLKNFKGIRHNLDEFEMSDNSYIKRQYETFRKRLQDLYARMKKIRELENSEEQSRKLMRTFVHIEEDDQKFIRETTEAVSREKVQEMQIATLLLVNRLFTQACRMQVYGLKDLFLTEMQVDNFNRALDMKEIMEEEKAESSEKNGQKD